MKNLQIQTTINRGSRQLVLCPQQCYDSNSHLTLKIRHHSGTVNTVFYNVKQKYTSVINSTKSSGVFLPLTYFRTELSGTTTKDTLLDTYPTGK
jgi:hypothetical protein